MNLITVKVNGIELDCYYEYKYFKVSIISIEPPASAFDIEPVLADDVINEIKEKILKHINGEKE